MGNITTKALQLDSDILNKLYEQARLSERKRAHYILRTSENGEIPGILFNIFFPGTYIRPHQHPSNDGHEICIPLSGKIKVILFNPDGSISKNYYLSAKETAFVEIPARTYHTIIALEPSVLCELYLGEYNLATYKEFAEWAPEENNLKSQEYLKKLLQ